MQQEIGLYVISVSSYMKSSEWGPWLLCDLLKFLTQYDLPDLRGKPQYHFPKLRGGRGRHGRFSRAFTPRRIISLTLKDFM